MGNLIEHPLYGEDLARVAALPLPWDKLQGASMLVSGATGLVGRCLVDVLMHKNRAEGLECKVYAMGRNAERAQRSFSYCWGSPMLEFVAHDVNEPFTAAPEHLDYAVHLASNTHPVAYATDPIGTITANIFGLKHLLDGCTGRGLRRFAFASSNEVYGENRGDTELFAENYCGYINCNTLRAGYPESKRCAEALCQAYIRQAGLDIVIARLTRSYGPTMLQSDTKAISQFIKKALGGEDIVLKSAGTQYYSYTYMADAVAGLLTILLKGECGCAYNVADVSSDITLKDLAGLIASHAGRHVVFEIPDAVEAAGYSTATKARLDGSALRALGWAPMYDMRNGLARTLEMLKG